MKVLTSEIRWYGRRLRVLAKLYRDNPVPVTYCNRTQADQKAAQLKADGIDCHVIGDRPYYVVIPATPTPTDAAPIPQEVAVELLQAMKALFKECAMIHRYGGEICNQKQADAAIQSAIDAIRKADGTEVKR